MIGLFEPDHNLKQKPICPMGGIYTLGKVSAKPQCSIARHKISAF
jgi:hypothetical protein